MPLNGRQKHSHHNSSRLRLLLPHLLPPQLAVDLIAALEPFLRNDGPRVFTQAKLPSRTAALLCAGFMADNLDALQLDALQTGVGRVQPWGD